MSFASLNAVPFYYGKPSLALYEDILSDYIRTVNLDGGRQRSIPFNIFSLNLDGGGGCVQSCRQNEFRFLRRCVPLWYRFAYYNLRFQWSVGNYSLTSSYRPVDANNPSLSFNATENICTATSLFLQSLAWSFELAKYFKVVYSETTPLVYSTSVDGNQAVTVWQCDIMLLSPLSGVSHR